MHNIGINNETIQYPSYANVVVFFYGGLPITASFRMFKNNLCWHKSWRTELHSLLLKHQCLISLRLGDVEINLNYISHNTLNNPVK